MKIYVFVKSHSSTDECTTISETRVFRTLHESLKHLNEEREVHLNNPDAEWYTDWETDRYCYLVCGDYTEEVVMAIEEHEI